MPSKSTVERARADERAGKREGTSAEWTETERARRPMTFPPRPVERLRQPASRTAAVNRSSSASRRHRLHSGLPHPRIDLPLGFVAGHAVAFLNSAD
jgi:hypothetical protein